MTINRFDQASRYAAKLDPAGFLRWLLPDPMLIFQGWLDTRSLPFPGEEDRTCDTVACLIDTAMRNRLWALAVEFQTRGGTALFGRLLEYLGRLYRELRPESGPRRFRVGAAVIHLTGRRRGGSRRMRLGRTRVLTRLSAQERWLADEDARATLAGIAAGNIAGCLLPWIPLMRGGGADDTITEWVRLAQAEPISRLRGEYGGLALVFSDLTRFRERWHKALEGWNMIESPTVQEWMAQGEAKGILKAQRKSLCFLLEARCGPLPEALRQQIEATTDVDHLREALLQASNIQTLDDFHL